MLTPRRYRMPIRAADQYRITVIQLSVMSIYRLCSHRPVAIQNHLRHNYIGLHSYHRLKEDKNKKEYLTTCKQKLSVSVTAFWFS